MIYDTPFKAEFEALGPIAVKLRRGMELTPEEMKLVEGMVTTPVDTIHPLQINTRMHGDLHNAITKKPFYSGGLAQIKECNCGK